MPSSPSTKPSAAHKRLPRIALVLVLIGTGCAAAGKYYDPDKANRTPSGFRNTYPQEPRASFVKWQWERITQGLPKAPANNYRFPMAVPEVAWLQANKTVPSVTWIGHATALLQIGGMNVLTDPMFSERASPFSFLGPRRKVPLNLPLAQLPHIDVVVISHNHYDHLDRASVEQLNRQAGGPPLFLVPLGVKEWMADLGIVNVREMDWWDKTDADSLAIHFVPAQHWSARSLTDRAETLWGSWVIKTADGAAHPFSVFFAGDTGYSKDFQDIGRKFGSFDLALIPIGAYAPRWFMKAHHVDPEEAVKIHQDVHAKRAIGIHWGSFEMTDEPLDEPPQRLAEAVKKAGLAAGEFTVLKHGETLKLD
ncbi:MBL fold metallo-hydrolase [Herbaspirillum sp. RV1423]|uniref:MBL fold metallo-hydrolase n=1 Tax=Herbaspirillum sp. RV1423 TaxID=1443993 RepID=UPI0012DC20B4|nr:MBL fold metallo-hydrolase [Herbaspirillum sp. RV1423]